ncbi:hypothetical protein ACK356_06720 [Aeromonas veronii]|uniref:hypothetical protein n=1 Tax=Aeromonas TaxID=642 RepID=UPI001115C98D|nr:MULTISPECIES: hypothetical protein [Aeromonas]MCF5874782.1 hypothetical protein [Aeromonas veronii]MCF5902413.1 hypothetical protein [Aeromonas veronii]MEB5667822.1 hypothetical protein [Aeromonas veronii]HDX8425513.1 hypothetical protein [Aeromonas veronii]
MDSSKITPERITKPIQLLGAWLVGLLSVDSAFLVAATRMDASSWQAGALVIAAIINVPVFIGALFLLQTKFRPELQEDSYYSTYLSSRTNEPIRVSRKDAHVIDLEKKIDSIEKLLSSNKTEPPSGLALSDLSCGVNIHLSDRVQILKKLNSIGILGFTEFGDDAAPPPFRKVAVSETLSHSELKEVLRLAQELGFTHYGYIQPFEEISEDILFGAYGTDDLRLITPA